MSAWFDPPRRGFTLVELLVVIIIVAILSALALAVLVGALGQGREANTRALIAKLNRGLNDRLTSLHSQAVTVQPVDLQLARGDTARAQIIAKKRVMKEQFPQWFAVDASTNTIVGDWDPLDADSDGTLGPQDQVPAQVSSVAQAYRNWIMNIPTRDGIDNDGDNQIDEPDEQQPSILFQQYLQNHDPRTTSAECLYLILAMGPGDSGVDPTTFPTREVADSDGDGIPELTDGWGNPIRFYRWPTHFPSASQKGNLPYQPGEQRQDDGADPNRLLVQPPWWDPNPTPNSGSPFYETAISTGVSVSPALLNWAPLAFHYLTDPGALASPPTPPATWWDNLSNPATARRAYKAEPLIVSAGPDGRFGIAMPLPTDATPLSQPLQRQVRSAAVPITRAVWQQMGSPGELEPEIDAYADNIHNHGLASDQ